MTETRKLRVFLCHSSQDKPIVRQLYQRLNAEGWIDPWLDEEKLLPGQDWDLEIEKAIETADAVIVCLSNNSVTKEGVVQKEIKRALDKAEEKPEDVIFIIPLRLEDCLIPRRLRIYQYQDYFKKIDAGYKRLCTSLKKRADTVSIDIFGIKEERIRKEREEQIRKEVDKRVRREEEKVIRKEIEKHIREEAAENKDAPLLETREIKKRKSESKLTTNIYEFPTQLKRKSSRHILGWIIEIVFSTGIILLDVLLIRLALQNNEWWVYALLVVWIILSGIIIFSGWFLMLGTFFDDLKSVLFVDKTETDLVILAGNKSLGLFSLVTRKMTSIYRGIRGHKRFVILPKLNHIIFEDGTVFDLKANKVLYKLGESFSNVVASGRKNNYLVVSGWKQVSVFDYLSKKTISTFKHFGSSYSPLIVSNDENLIVGYDDAVSSLKIWSLILKKEIDSFTVDPMSNYDSFLVMNKEDNILAIVNDSKMILYSLPKRKKLLKLSTYRKILSVIFVPDSPYVVASIWFEGLIVLNTITGEYLKIETDNDIGKLLYLESSKEIIGFKDYKYKYTIWSVDDLVKAYQEAKGKNRD